MNYLINDRKPASVFHFFEEISAIPRPSYHEEKIADYLVNFAKERGLECYRDAAHNVLIKAPATKGWESRPALLLQGHTDMVCEKNGDVEHDFLKDPIKLRVEGKYLRATGTTLGADDGIAVALMLALLDGAVEAHPALECLFTTAEDIVIITIQRNICSACTREIVLKEFVGEATTRGEIDFELRVSTARLKFVNLC